MKHTNSIILQLCFTTILSAIGSVSSAQDHSCATVPTSAELEALASQPIQAGRMSSEIYTIKVVMYRIRHTDGSGALNDSAFADQINQLNTFYDQDDICFSLMKIVNIDNSGYIMPWYHPDSMNVDSMINEIVAANPPFGDAQTMYILPPETWYRGMSFGIPSNSLIISSQRFNWPVHLAHEAGHNFGSLHTHDDTGLAQEYVNRSCALPPVPAWSNCCTAADLFCSTEADPKLGDTNALGDIRVDPNTCMYIDTFTTDILGALYEPMTNNIMSYAPFNCRDSFTFQQLDRMYFNLDVAAPLQGLKATVGTLILDAQDWVTGWRHEMSRDEIEVSGTGTYTIQGDAQVMHRAETYVDLNPGFLATPGSSGYYVAKPGDLCGNSTEESYVIDN